MSDTPNFTPNEQKFLTELQTLLGKSTLPAELQNTLLEQVTGRLGGGDEATMAQVRSIVNEGAQAYVQNMEKDLQQLRNDGMFYKPKYQTPPNNGANAFLFRAMDAIDSLRQQNTAQAQEGSVQLELMNIKPQIEQALAHSGLKRGRHH